MASLHELRELLVQRDYFLSFDDLLEAVRDASVKYKFSFKTPHKDPKRARYKCKNKDCPWKVNTHLNPEKLRSGLLGRVVSYRNTAFSHERILL